MNRRKIQRLWHKEGLRVPTKRRKHQRLEGSTTLYERLQAEPFTCTDVRPGGRGRFRLVVEAPLRLDAVSADR